MTVWRHCETARLDVRQLSDSFIDSYLNREWPAVSGCVGVFRIEALGVQAVRTDRRSHFTVLGMPLLAVLAALRAQGELEA
jgi:septum formation protein